MKPKDSIFLDAMLERGGADAVIASAYKSSPEKVCALLCDYLGYSCSFTEKAIHWKNQVGQAGVGVGFHHYLIRSVHFSGDLLREGYWLAHLLDQITSLLVYQPLKLAVSVSIDPGSRSWRQIRELLHSGTIREVELAGISGSACPTLVWEAFSGVRVLKTRGSLHGWDSLPSGLSCFHLREVEHLNLDLEPCVGRIQEIGLFDYGGPIDRVLQLLRRCQVVRISQPDGPLEILEEMLATNVSCETLDLSGCFVGDECITLFERSTRRLADLKKLILNGTFLSPEGCDRLQVLLGCEVEAVSLRDPLRWFG